MKRRRFTILAFAFIGSFCFSACLAKYRYGKKYAEIYCERIKECSPDLFNAAYGSTEHCEGMLEAIHNDLADECVDYNASLARDCINEMKGASCDDFLRQGGVVEACEDLSIDCEFYWSGDPDNAPLQYDGGASAWGFADIRWTP